VVEFTLFEIAGAAERYGPGVTEQLPLPLSGLERGTCAVDGVTGNKPAIDEIESQCNAMKWVNSAINAHPAEVASPVNLSS
jgi:hypothetical protein